MIEPLGGAGAAVPETGEVAESSLSLADSKRPASPWRGGMAVIGAVGGACIAVGVGDRRGNVGVRRHLHKHATHLTRHALFVGPSRLNAMFSLKWHSTPKKKEKFG